MRCALGVVALAACGGRASAPRRDVATDARAVDAMAEGEPPRGKTIALVYTSNVGAEYERCGCPVHPLGGLGRRAAEVDKIRAESDGVVSVDAGDLFLPLDEPRTGARPPAASEVERRARLLASAYARLGVTAFSPGERDLALGAPLLQRVLADAKVPVVSANLFDLRGRPLFAADRLVDVAGLKIGIFGVTALASEDPRRLRAWGVEAHDAVTAARAEVASLRARGARVVVALVHAGGAPDNRKLVASVPGVDWAVLGHSGLNLETPERAATPGGDGARLLEALSLGRNLGRLDLHVVARDGVGSFVDRGARAQLQAILADHRQQVVDYEQRLPTTQSQPTLNDYYAKRLVALRAAIARETRELAATPARVTGNWFENRIVPLDTRVADQPGVASLVAEYNRQSDRLAAEGKPVGVSARVAGAPVHVAPLTEAPTATYVGTASCVSCHRPAAEFWRATKHARALATLEQAHRACSPACIGCHVTGYLQPGGTDDVEVATTRLGDVGCESCHGPGSAHVVAPSAPGKIARAVAASVCLGCHTPDQTNAGFDYLAFRGAIVGPGHGAPAR